MKLQDFLTHHGLRSHPFSVEDAQSDTVFKDHCIATTFHPAWDKVYGNPSDPSTALVFGEKGSGKTALRLQLQKHIADYNHQNPQSRSFVIAYDDFNPFLDEFRDRMRQRMRPERLLREYQLWDHIDAILTLGTTELIDRMLNTSSQSTNDGGNFVDRSYRRRLRGHQRRDLLLLASFYDHATTTSDYSRWHRLQRRLFTFNLSHWWPFALGLIGTVGIAAGLYALAVRSDGSPWNRLVALGQQYGWLIAILILAAWIPWLWRSGRRWLTAWKIARHVRVIPRRVWPLFRLLMGFSAEQLADQPLPSKQRTDDRYALLGKFQSILQALGFSSIVVLVDRVDEPHLINGSPDLMKAFLWPMLDNKFLKQPGLALKFMLPQELAYFIDRESPEFYQRARLDKQNVVPSMSWTGEALFDLVNTRLAACSDQNDPPKLTDLLDESISTHRIFDALQALRVPRHVFKFLYRAMASHVNRHSQQTPDFRIRSDIFESEFALYRREQDAADRGQAAG